MATTTIASLSLNPDYSLSVSLNLLIVIGLGLIFLALFLIKYRFFGWFNPSFSIDTAEIGIGSQKFSFKPNYRDQEIAYKIWVELSTRKIGLPIDLEHDVVSEIYDSWHNFFTITRELIKDVPVNKVSDEGTRQIITLSISVLNRGLRPHLTRWQARFRRWYEKQLATAPDDVDPQTIQAKYPNYQELMKDLMVVNGRLMKYREKMRELVLGLTEDESVIIPEQPIL